MNINDFKFETATGKTFIDYVSLAKKFIKIQSLWYDKAKIWWAWNSKNNCWERIDEIDLINLVDKSLRWSGTIHRDTKNKIIDALQRQSRLNKPKPAKKTWIQFKDRIVDINSKVKFKATSNWFVTNPIPWEIGKSKKTPIIDKIFKEWVGEKYVKTLYEIVAYCLLSDYPIHRVFALVGKGLNGKSKFIELICKLVGKDNRTTTDLNRLTNSRFESAKLFKKLVCILGETNFNALKKTALFKNLTGQDTIGFEIKNKDPFDEYNYATIVIATNTLPITLDKTIGFYRRWMIIDFPNTFNEKKDILADIPEEEYRNLCKKSVGILKELLERGSFTNEGDIKERIKKYEEKSNPLSKFLEEFCIVNSDAKMPIFEFYDKYNKFLRKKGFRTLTRQEIWIQLKYDGFEKKVERFYINDGDYSTKMYLYGVRLKGEKGVKDYV